MPESTPSFLPVIHITIANLAVKVDAEVSNQKEGEKGAGRLIAVLVLICYMVAVSLPCFLPALIYCGSAFMKHYHECFHDPKQLGQFWESFLSTNFRGSNFNNQGIFEWTWNQGMFCNPLDCFWLLAASNKLLENKQQMENPTSNYIARWMFHFQYCCLCEDIQLECVIAKRNMHWSLYQEAGMTALCKYYFIYCQQS